MDKFVKLSDVLDLLWEHGLGLDHSHVNALPIYTSPDSPSVPIPQMASLGSAGKYTELGGIPKTAPHHSEDMLDMVKAPDNDLKDKIQGLQADLRELIRVCLNRDLATIKDFIKMNYSLEYQTHKIAENALGVAPDNKLLEMAESITFLKDVGYGACQMMVNPEKLQAFCIELAKRSGVD